MLKTKEKIVYKAFGYKIVSDISFPELPVVGESTEKQDIQIEFGDFTKHKKELENNPYFHAVLDNQVLFYVPDVAFFSIQEGSKILFSPKHNVEEDLLRLYLLGTCMGVILMQRNILPLHGSAIEIDGKAYAFIGESGAGKSTLASAFMKRGFSLVSDDIIPVSFENSIPFVIPSYPQQKLWQESLDHLGMDSTKLKPIYERETKFNVPVQTKFTGRPLQLAGIFELSKQNLGEVNLLKIGKLQSLKTLFAHTYRNFLIPRLGILDWHFIISTRIINDLNIFRLQRPMNGYTANDLVSLVLGTINKEDK
ncbi:aldolase [Neobacillus drentensis]|uniref:HPr kinase/phosphorylase n=1 Tax=Neobacillus drentensis TaxID=220684 RepID=UPI002FFED59E